MAKKERDQDGRGLLFCSFCGKNQNEVKKLVAGPTAYICDECIELCRCIVEEECEKPVTEELRKGIPEPKRHYEISGSVRHRTGKIQEGSVRGRL